MIAVYLKRRALTREFGVSDIDGHRELGMILAAGAGTQLELPMLQNIVAVAQVS